MTNSSRKGLIKEKKYLELKQNILQLKNSQLNI